MTAAVFTLGRAGGFGPYRKQFSNPFTYTSLMEILYRLLFPSPEVLQMNQQHESDFTYSSFKHASQEPFGIQESLNREKS